MPDMDGYEYATKIRDISYNELIFALTWDDNNVIKINFLQSGADYVMIKPFNVDKLNLIINFVKKYGTIRYKNKQIKNINNSLEWINWIIYISFYVKTI